MHCTIYYSQALYTILCIPYSVYHTLYTILKNAKRTKLYTIHTNASGVDNSHPSAHEELDQEVSDQVGMRSAVRGLDY